MTHDRPCVRGCLQRGEHFAACPDYGRDDGECRGCVPYLAREGALLCSRCFFRLRRHVDDAPDMVGHLRSIADPTKAREYKLVLAASARQEMPAPVSADLVDASTDIVRTLRDWAGHAGGERSAYRLAPGESADVAHDDARVFADVILAHFDELANGPDVVALADAFLFAHKGEPEWWSVADAMGKWPLEDRPWWAVEPCPECDLKTVWVTPPRRMMQPARFRCVSCEWESDDTDEGGLWAAVYAETRVAE